MYDKVIDDELELQTPGPDVIAGCTEGLFPVMIEGCLEGADNN